MDLLSHYDDSSSSEEEDSTHNKVQERAAPIRTESIVDEQYPSKLPSDSRTLSDRIRLLPNFQTLENHNHMFVRNKPHVTGNWCGHVYISLKQLNEDSYHVLKDQARTTIKQFHKLLLSNKVLESEKESEIITIVPFINMRDEESSCSEDNDSVDSMEEDLDDETSLHISLSRHFYLQHQSIETFLQDLRDRLSLMPALIFSSSCMKPKILTNDDATRSFLCLELAHKEQERCYSQICSLIQAVDSVLKKYGCETYYQSPSVHTSVASWRYNKGILDSFSNRNEDVFSENSDGLGAVFRISKVQCDFGTNEKHTILLNGM